MQTETRRPAAGNTFLVVSLEITNSGPAVTLRRQQVALRAKDGTSYTPFFWEHDLGLVSEQGESFDIQNSARINTVFDIPKDGADTLTVSIDGKPVAQLNEFKLKKR